MEIAKAVVELIGVLAWPVTFLIIGLIFSSALKETRYSSPMHGPSGTIIRTDRRRDKIQVYERGKWYDSCDKCGGRTEGGHCKDCI